MKKPLAVFTVGMALLLAFTLGYSRRGGSLKDAHRVLYYQDPMHPSYRSDKPGIAPDCGMKLVPIYAEGLGQSVIANEIPSPGAVLIDSPMQQLYGVKLVQVERTSGHQTIRAFARVEADETRIFHVNFGTDGFVKETHDDASGNYVTKNQHLALVYSPEFLAVAGGYLAANEHSPAALNQGKDSSGPPPSYNTASAQARADRLRDLGMSDAQIDEIGQNRKLPEDIYVVSPVNGFILSRNISAGMRFERHVDLYTIADLSRVWIVAEIFGKDAQALRPGAVARITLPDTHESFTAKVSDVLPEVDPHTYSYKVRLEAENIGYRLRPNMFVDVEMPLSLPPGLMIPADAIVDSGLEKRVFVRASESKFEPRAVETGLRIGERVEILKGLKAGETVVASGMFLVDSESKMQIAGKSSGLSGNASRPDIELERHIN